MSEEAEIGRHKDVYQKWQETGENPGGTEYTLDDLKIAVDSWYVNICMDAMIKHPKTFRDIPEVEQDLIVPKQKKYLKRGGKYVDVFYKDRRKEEFQFTNKSIREGYCWRDVADGHNTMYETGGTDNYNYNFEPVGHNNLVEVQNAMIHHPKSYYDNLKTLYKVNLYI